MFIVDSKDADGIVIRKRASVDARLYEKFKKLFFVIHFRNNFFQAVQ